MIILKLQRFFSFLISVKSAIVSVIFHIFPQILFQNLSPPHNVASVVKSHLFLFTGINILPCTSFTQFTKVILVLQEFLSFLLYPLVSIFSTFPSKHLLSSSFSHSPFNSQPLISPVCGAEKVFILLFTPTKRAAESYGYGTE